MLWIIAFGLAALLMHVSGKATGHPMAFVGVIYLGGIMYVFGLLALKIIGVTT